MENQNQEFCIIESERIKTHTDDNVINLVLHTLELNKQVLVFNNSKRSSETTAEKIANSLKKIENQEELNELSEKILSVLSSPTKQCKRLSNCIKRGTAFHHSGVLAKQRGLIEKYFKKGIIKVISSTPTLAAGLNLPAYKVIIKDYRRYSQRGMADIPILEYHQMSGRAGRPGKEDIGKAVLCVKSENELERLVPKYLFGKSEEILSKLAIEPILKMYVLSLISMNMINSKEEIIKFFSNTLYANQYGDIDELSQNIFRIIGLLKEYTFVTQDDNYYVATPLGKKVSELYLNPDTANYFLTNLDKFVKRFSSEEISREDVYSLINFVANTIEMRPLFKVSKIEEETYIKKLEEKGNQLIIPFDPFETDYQTFINSLKTTDIFQDWILEAPEDYISDKYNITPGELAYKQETMDWLLYALENLAFLKKEIFFKNYLSKLRMRFKYGIRDELIPLINLKGIGRARARKLYKAGFKKILDLKKADFSSLEKVVGTSIAIKIKEQVSDQTELNNQTLPVPKEIQFREVKEPKEVSDDEINRLVENYETFEKEKKEKNMNLKDYF